MSFRKQLHQLRVRFVINLLQVKYGSFRRKSLHGQLYIEQLVLGPASALPTLRDAGLRNKTSKILVILLNSNTKNSYSKAVDGGLTTQKPSYALKKIKITIDIKK